jgi:hypothetical protein
MKLFFFACYFTSFLTSSGLGFGKATEPLMPAASLEPLAVSLVLVWVLVEVCETAAPPPVE